MSGRVSFHPPIFDIMPFLCPFFLIIISTCRLNIPRSTKMVSSNTGKSQTTTATSASALSLNLTILFFILVVRHVILPKDMAKGLPKGRTLTEHEWRGSGVQQSRGWEHYACHRYCSLTFHCYASSVVLYIAHIFYSLMFVIHPV